MGENNIELTGGTLYFNGIECSTGDGLIMDNVEFSDSNIRDILSNIREVQSVEFTGTCKIKFRGLVMLLGFWPAVMWKIDSFKAGLKRRLSRGRERSENST